MPPTKTEAVKALDGIRLEALLGRMRRGKDLYRDIVWPGGEAPIRLRVCTVSETQAALAGAVARFRALSVPVDAVTLEEFAAEQITQTIFIAASDPARPVPGTRGLCESFFSDADECRDLLLPDERVALWSAYLELEQSVNPEPDTLDAATLEAISEAQKKREPRILLGVGSTALRIYVATMVAPSSSSPTGRSDSSPSSETQSTPDA